MEWARYTNVDSMYTTIDSVTHTNYAMCTQTLSHLPASAHTPNTNIPCV